jgi:hypothetical protein
MASTIRTYSGPICISKIAMCARSPIDPGAMAFNRCTSNATAHGHEFARTAAALASGFAKLGEQLAERGEFHSPVPFFKFIPEVAGRLQSRDMNADVGGQVPEDSVVGLGFAARPFTVALLHFEARFNGPLPHRPVEVGLHQGVDVRRNRFGVLE